MVDQVYTVSELTRGIREILELSLPYLRVRGEVSNLRTPPSGHSYFTLKDEASQLRCVLFRNRPSVPPQSPSRGSGEKGESGSGLADGMEVILSGRIGLYEKRGEYQLIAEDLHSLGTGALQLDFEELKRKLADEGLFDQERKRPVPPFVGRIGVITSPTGAAIQDILNVMERRFSNVEVALFPVRVQGERAAKEIAAAIEVMNRIGGFDCLIVGRGGGSLEDLWAFNEETMARAIYSSHLPVISAVGHEIDYTIADFVADLRAPTPSAAAELVVQNRDELLGRVDELRARITIESSRAKGTIDEKPK